MFRVLTGAAIFGVGVFVVLAGSLSDARTQTSEAQGLEAWNTAFEVFSHARCVNCHVPADNKPRWSGPSYEGRGPYHGMGVVADDTRSKAAGLSCATCHRASNMPFPRGAPGAPNWVLAPVEMVWWDQSSTQICEQIKDPERNGGKSVEQVAQHVVDDPLVLWGWAPGPGREPAPHSAEEVKTALLTWQNAGTPCPAAD